MCDIEHTIEGYKMAITFNEDSVGAGRGMGLFGGGSDGGGTVLGLLLGMMFGNNRNGWGNNGNDNNVVTTTDLIQQTLGDIKASIPYNEAQVQLALAQSMASLTGQMNANTQHLSSEVGAQSLAAANIAASLARDIASVDTNVDRQATALQMAISSDGEKTRALITSNQIAELNQKLTIAQTEALELRQRNERDRDRHGIEISMTNNQNQNQLQFQAQSQTLNTLANGVIQALQSIQATNQAINIGSGGMIANPNNTNTNVRA
jgi:hypothetical protein